MLAGRCAERNAAQGSRRGELYEKQAKFGCGKDLLETRPTERSFGREYFAGRYKEIFTGRQGINRRCGCYNEIRRKGREGECFVASTLCSIRPRKVSRSIHSNVGAW